MRDGAEDVEHELASRGRGVEVLLEADKVDAKCVELVHGLEQLLERTAEAVEVGDTQGVARAGVIDEFGEAGSVEALSGHDVGEDTDGARLGRRSRWAWRLWSAVETRA